MTMISVVIPSFNGRKLLEQHLPALMSACSSSDFPVEVIIVDDASDDDTISFLRSRYPSAKLIEHRVNMGFAEAMNSGITEAKGTIVLALNNDILVKEDLFSKCRQWFRDHGVFSVTPNMIDPLTGKCQSLTKIKTGFCWFDTLFLQPKEVTFSNGEMPIFFGSGGGSFYDREKLLRIGGFDPIYYPFYIEDMDLSFRAWKAGWKCLFDPEITIYHMSSSTIRKIHKKRKIKLIGDKNRTLLLWLNVSDSFLIARYFLFLPISFILDLVKFRKYKFIGFFWALKYLPRIPGLRRKRKGYFRISDQEVLNYIRVNHNV
jgi:GT2 family glycosyltransferase